jgi:hypothetical protein
MGNSTTTYWDVDGTSLQTYAQNIETLGGSRDGLPTFRGTNSEIAYRRGALWHAKTPEQRIVSLGFWVQGTDSNGAVTGMGEKAQYAANMRAIKSLVWKDFGAQINLTKRWLHTDGSTIKSATALAEFAGMTDPVMVGPYASRFVLDFLLADPYFYAAEVTQAVPYQPTPWTSFTAEGDVITNRVTLEMNGPLTNPTLTLSDPTPDIFVTLGVTVAGADKVTLDCDMYTAIRTSDSANLIGSVTHSGSRNWMYVRPGTNTMLLTGSSGSGNCSVKYRPAYW